MWASVWRKNKMGAWARRAPPLNPPLQSAFQSVIRKVRKKDLVLGMYVYIMPPQFVMSRKQNLLLPCWLLLIHIFQVNLSVHLAYIRGINNFMEQSHVSTNFLPYFCFYHALCKSRPGLDEGLSRPRASTSFNEPGFHFSWLLAFMTITCFLDSW